MYELGECTLDKGIEEEWEWKDTQTNTFIVKSAYKKIRNRIMGENIDIFGQF